MSDDKLGAQFNDIIRGGMSALEATELRNRAYYQSRDAAAYVPPTRNDKLLDDNDPAAYRGGMVGGEFEDDYGARSENPNFDQAEEKEREQESQRRVAAFHLARMASFSPESIKTDEYGPYVHASAPKGWEHKWDGGRHIDHFKGGVWHSATDIFREGHEILTPETFAALNKKAEER